MAYLCFIKTMKKMTHAQIFKAAHELAREFSGDYRARFALAIRIVRNQADAIQAIKLILLDFNMRYNYFAPNGDFAAYARIIDLVADAKSIGFASEVASTVRKFKSISEKQAFVIARAYVQNGFAAGVSRMDFRYAA
jgi:hypothetical protein